MPFVWMGDVEISGKAWDVLGSLPSVFTPVAFPLFPSVPQILLNPLVVHIPLGFRSDCRLSRGLWGSTGQGYALHMPW